MTGVRNVLPYLACGIWLFVPALAIAQAFAARYPPAFQPHTFNQGIPTPLLVAENVLRVLLFAVAAAMPLMQRPAARLLGISVRPLGISTRTFGIAVYLLGLAAYAASFAMICLATDSRWSRSVLGLTAPAWTPAVWLIGITMLTGPIRGLPRSRPWMYLVLCAVFLAVHITHTALAVTRQPAGTSARPFTAASPEPPRTVRPETRPTPWPRERPASPADLGEG